MAKIDRVFHTLVDKILQEGYWYDDPYREGVQRREISSYRLEHDLTKGFPAITTKELYWNGVVGELIWFLHGSTSPKYLIDNGINIWNKDGARFTNSQTGGNLTEKEYARLIKQDQLVGDLGRIYGAQWRQWGVPHEVEEGWGSYIDQIARLIKGMKERPLATDLLVTAWNPSELTNMALPPCHFGFQIAGRPLSKIERIRGLSGFNAFLMSPSHEELDELEAPKYGFELIWDQRSVDTFLGLPFNIASYALLAHILGLMTDMVPLKIVGNLRKVHLYRNSIDQVKELLSRDFDKYPNCELGINETATRILKSKKGLDEKLHLLDIADFRLKGYESYTPLRTEMLSRD